MNSPWIKVKSFQQLSCDKEIYLARWNGRICIAQYKREDDCIFASFNPAELGQFKITRDKWDKFDYFLPTNILEIIDVDDYISYNRIYFDGHDNE